MNAHNPITIYDFQRGLMIKCSCGWNSGWGREDQVTLDFASHATNFADSTAVLSPADPQADVVMMLGEVNKRLDNISYQLDQLIILMRECN